MSTKIKVEALSRSTKADQNPAKAPRRPAKNKAREHKSSIRGPELTEAQVLGEKVWRSNIQSEKTTKQNKTQLFNGF